VVYIRIHFQGCGQHTISVMYSYTFSGVQPAYNFCYVSVYTFRGAASIQFLWCIRIHFQGCSQHTISVVYPYTFLGVQPAYNFCDVSAYIFRGAASIQFL
jgi:hypothetical protein